MIRSISVLLVVIALFAVGCKKGPVSKLQAAPPPQLESGWTTFDAGSFTIAAPSNYKSKPPPAVQMPGMEEPVVQQAVESVGGGKTEGLIMTLYDWNTRPTIGEELTAVKISREPGYSDLESAIEDAKRSTGEKQFEKVTLPVGQAAVFKSSSRSVGGDDLHDVVYVLVHNGDMYKFVWHVTTHPINVIEEPAAKMMQTFRVK